MRYLLSLLISLIILFEGLSQEMDVDSVNTILEEVTVQSDLFGHDLIELPGSVSVITALDMQRANGVQLQPIINAIPGVYMQSGALNTNRITIRGIGARSPFSTNKIKAYLDEIPLSSGEGETTIEDIDFATLGGVEVYRGPISTTFGAGLGGAIHMISKTPNGKSNMSFESSYGSFGLFRNQLGLQLASSDKSLSLYYQDIHSDGYRDNNEYDRQSITLLGKLFLGNQSTLSSYLNYSKLLAYIPSSLNEEDYENNPTNAASSWGNAEGNEDNSRFRAGVSLNTTWNDQLESSLTVFMNSGNSNEVRPTFLGNTGVDYVNFGFRGNVKRSFFDRNQLSVALGTELFLENYTYQEFENINSQNGNLTLDYSQNRNYGNVFLVSEYKPNEHWLVTLGTNLNFSSYKLDDNYNVGGDDLSGEFKFSPVFSPKLSVTRFLSNDIALYALAAHGFSLPTFEETLYPDGEVNTELKPESGFNYELGLKGAMFNNQLLFELALYSMIVNDLIVDQVVDNVLYGINAGNAHHNGLEMMLDHNIVKNDILEWNHRLSLTLMKYKFDEFVDGENDYSGNEMTGVPNRNLDYKMSVKTAMGHYGNVNWQSVGAMPILDDNSIYTDSYNLVNLKVGFQKSIEKVIIDIYAGVNNILDEKYASMIQINTFTGRYYYPGLPVNYFAGAKLVYQFN
ncbi:MAG: TonB-dependent receptor [Reichenbachiella sp.]